MTATGKVVPGAWLGRRRGVPGGRAAAHERGAACRPSTTGARLVLEVQQHLDPRRVRAVALAFTEGLRRGGPRRGDGGADLGSRRRQRARPPRRRPWRSHRSPAAAGPADTPRRPIHRPAPPLHGAGARPRGLSDGRQDRRLCSRRWRAAARPGLFGGSGSRQDRPADGADSSDRPAHRGIAVFAGVGERSREGNELWIEMRSSGVLQKTALVFGQMNEPPGRPLARRHDRARARGVLPRRASTPTSSCSSTTCSVSCKRAAKSPGCSGACHRASGTNPRSRPRSPTSRSASRRWPAPPSRPSRPCTCRPTT